VDCLVKLVEEKKIDPLDVVKYETTGVLNPSAQKHVAEHFVRKSLSKFEGSKISAQLRQQIQAEATRVLQDLENAHHLIGPNVTVELTDNNLTVNVSAGGPARPALDTATGRELDALVSATVAQREPGESDAEFRERIMARLDELHQKPDPMEQWKRKKADWDF
jgi:predicted RNA-binding protein Jag